MNAGQPVGATEYGITTKGMGQPLAATKELITTKGTKSTKERGWRRIDIHATAQRRKGAEETIQGAMRGYGGRGIGFGATKSAKITKDTGEPLAAARELITTMGTKRNREGL
ncbi:MAG: hypothetical protein KF886_03365 [Candidatus Hydrogenedentes bacterium]|nr:hypothetical protein [Candidatus Hydrogenedentota bacterium]